MTKALVFTMIGVLALALRTLLYVHFSFGPWAPDVLLIVVVYLGIFRNPFHGAVIVFLLGFLADLASHGGYLGLSSLAYLAIFFGARLIGKVFYARNPLIQVIITAVAGVVFALMVHYALYRFGVAEFMLPRYFSDLVVRCAVSGLLAPALFWLLFRVEEWTTTEIEDKQGTGIGPKQKSGWVQ